MVALPNEAAERVGKFEMSVGVADRTTEADERWQNRSHVLAAWLREKWHMERGRLRRPHTLSPRQMAERN